MLDGQSGLDMTKSRHIIAFNGQCFLEYFADPDKLFPGTQNGIIISKDLGYRCPSVLILEFCCRSFNGNLSWKGGRARKAVYCGVTKVPMIKTLPALITERLTDGSPC